MLISNEDATDEVVRLERTIGYPKDTDGLGRLRDGLINACNRYGVQPNKIIDECLAASQHCPTDYDLFQVAKGIRGPETWKAPDVPPDNGPGAWTPEQRRIHDAKWAKFAADPKNAKIFGLLKKYGAA